MLSIKHHVEKGAWLKHVAGMNLAAFGATPQEDFLEIRVISSLTLDDEARYAKTFLKLLAAVLESVPTSYAIHVQLADGAVIQHGSAAKESAATDSGHETQSFERLPARVQGAQFLPTRR